MFLMFLRTGGLWSISLCGSQSRLQILGICWPSSLFELYWVDDYDTVGSAVKSHLPIDIYEWHASQATSSTTCRPHVGI